MRVTLNIFNRGAEEEESLLNVEIFPDMTISTLRESVQADTGIPPTSQHIYHNGRIILDETKTMEQLQISDGDMLAVHVRDMRRHAAGAAPQQPHRQPQQQQAQPAQPAATQRPGGPYQNDPELVRLQLLGNPDMRQQLQRQRPELAAAVEDPALFAQVLSQSQDREQRERLQRLREIERLNNDPFNIENQMKIEEMIRQERVMENLQNAMEHNPEVFGRVHLLYIYVEVNGHSFKGLVDSGAQATIMSPACAEACGIMRLVDTRFAGVARGVGTANILGRVHSAQIKIGNLYLPCSFTVMEGKSVDLLLGLDMLKRFQATIDLTKDKLIIHGEEIPFLGEAEVPREEEAAAQEPLVPGPAGASIGQQTGAVISSAPRAASHVAQAKAQVDPSAPSSAPVAAGQKSTSPPVGEQSPESGVRVSPQHVESLISMGATRQQAVQALQAAEDNVDVAASLIFF